MDNLFEGLFNISDDTDQDAATESVGFEMDDDDSATELTAAAESAILLDTLASTFASQEEYVAYVMENATFMEMYGLLDNAEAAVEAVKRIQIQDWKKVKFNRLVKRECLRIEAKRDSQLWKKYSKHRKLMREARAAIFQKNMAIAKRNVRQSLQNSGHKAASMNTSGGGDLKRRLDSSISTSQSGKNPTNGKIANPTKQ